MTSQSIRNSLIVDSMLCIEQANASMRLIASRTCRHSIQIQHQDDDAVEASEKTRLYILIRSSEKNLMRQQLKKCTRCGEVKFATREYFGSTPSGGVRGYCRICMNKDSANYERKNKEKRQERDSKRARAHPEARTAFDVSTKRALMKRQEGLCPCCVQPISAISDAEIDHATPLAKGGIHHPSNFIVTHAQCNREKHNKTLAEHWEWRVRVGLDEENLGHKHGLLGESNT
jgi:5-methylcytosine-specific restriction endonuclease McrA